MKKKQILLGAITALLMAAGLLLASCDPVFCNKDRKCSNQKSEYCSRAKCAAVEAALDKDKNVSCDCP